MVNSGYGNHFAEGWWSDDNSEDIGVDWEDTVPFNGEVDMDSKWPEGFSAGQPTQQ